MATTRESKIFVVNGGTRQEKTGQYGYEYRTTIIEGEEDMLFSVVTDLDNNFVDRVVVDVEMLEALREHLNESLIAFRKANKAPRNFGSDEI